MNKQGDEMKIKTNQTIVWLTQPTIKKDINTTEYNVCPKCGELVFDEDHEWQGEDDNGVGHTLVHEACEGCGKLFSYIISE